MSPVGSPIRPELNGLPPELLEQIAFSLVQESPYAAPSDLVLSMLLLNKRFHSLLAPEYNQRLYARLFKAKFDTQAIGRRFGTDSLRAWVLAEEYKKRIVTLTRLRNLGHQGLLYLVGDAGGVQQMTKDLWTAYLMVLENGRHALTAMVFLPEQCVGRLQECRPASPARPNPSLPGDILCALFTYAVR